jgi:hypothetical protein
MGRSPTDARRAQAAALLAVAQTKAFAVGQLVSLDWKLGVAAEASTVAHVDTPYVTLALRVADPSGAVTATSVVLTVSEFKVRADPREREREKEQERGPAHQHGASTIRALCAQRDALAIHSCFGVGGRTCWPR